MAREKRKILVIGNIRIPLPSVSRVRVFLERKIQIANLNIPVRWLLAAAVVVVIVAVLLTNFGPGQQKPDPTGGGSDSGVTAGAPVGDSSGGSDGSAPGTETDPQIPEVSPNKGKFIIEKIDAKTLQPITDGAVGIEAVSEDAELAGSVKEIINGKQQDAAASNILQTTAQGQVVLDLPTLPWVGGKNLILTVTEPSTASHIGMQPFKVVIEPQNGTVVSVESAPGEQKRVKVLSDQYGVSVTSQPVVTDNAFYDVALRTWIKKIDRVSGGETENAFYDENPNISDIPVEDGDIVLVRVDVYNQCLNTVIIPEIMDWASSGLTFDPTLTIAHIDPAQPAYTNNDWELVSGGDGQPDKLRFKGDPIRIDPWNGKDRVYPEKRYAIVLKVDKSKIPAGSGGDVTLSNTAEIQRIQNADGQDVTDADSVSDAYRFNEGVVSDNNIEERRKDAADKMNFSQDEDDHDIASVIAQGVPAALPVASGDTDGFVAAGAGTSGTADGTKPAEQDGAAFKSWMLIPIVVAILALGVCLWMLYGQRKSRKEKVSRRRRRGI